MTAIAITAMTADEARATVERIKSKLEDVRALVGALHERDGWKALGYETWQACIQAEFHMSPQHAHRLLNAHRVDRMLAAPWQESAAFFGRNATGDPDSPPGESEGGVARIPERHARELEPLTADPDAVREVVADVMAQTAGKPTAADYRRAVEEHLGIESEVADAMPDPEVAAAAMAEAAALLEEPEEERAFFLVSRQRFWMKLPPERVADASTAPDQDAPEWEAFGAWCSRVGQSLRARSRQRVRLVE